MELKYYTIIYYIMRYQFKQYSLIYVYYILNIIYSWNWVVHFENNHKLHFFTSLGPEFDLKKKSSFLQKKNFPDCLQYIFCTHKRIQINIHSSAIFIQMRIKKCLITNIFKLTVHSSHYFEYDKLVKSWRPFRKSWYNIVMSYRTVITRETLWIYHLHNRNFDTFNQGL